MKEIPLTQGRAVIVDDEDFEKLRHQKWWATTPNKSTVIYAVGKQKVSRNIWSTALMHRIIMGLAKGDKRQIDHINGDGLDNRKANLRLCSASQNHFNTTKPKNNTSGYKGIHWNKTKEKWQVQLRIDGVQTYLGRYKSLKVATSIYIEAVKKQHGEFANLNA